MRTIKTAVAFTLATAAILLGVSLHARGSVSDTNYLTFNRPVSLPGVTLGAGTYIFERASQNAPDIVRVLSRDRKAVYFMGFTLSIARPETLGNRVVLLGEARPDSAVPIKAWFPIGEAVGRQFIYVR
jgi:hypothetical protein